MSFSQNFDLEKKYNLNNNMNNNSNNKPIIDQNSGKNIAVIHF